MPKLATLIKILRDGTRKSGFLKECNEDTGGISLALRDHYARLEQFWSKKYPKQNRSFVDASAAKAAISADRDSTLGILDTIVREFVTFWMPELEAFMEHDQEDADKETYVRVIIEIEENIVNVVNRLDYIGNETAIVLQGALIKLIGSYLQDLFSMYESLLDDDERALYDPKNCISKGRSTNSHKNTTIKSVDESISEARLLNSAIAWEVSDHQELTTKPHVPVLKSLVKRSFSEAFDEHGADPADNGAVWDTCQTAKRQKFEVKISKVIDVSDSDDTDDGRPAPTNRSRRVLKPVSRSNKIKKIVSKSSIVITDDIDAQMDVEVPGALKTNDENCILM